MPEKKEVFTPQELLTKAEQEEMKATYLAWSDAEYKKKAEPILRNRCAYFEIKGNSTFNSLEKSINTNGSMVSVPNKNFLLTPEEVSFIFDNVNPAKVWKYLSTFEVEIKRDREGEISTITPKITYNRLSYTVMVLTAIYHLTESPENISYQSREVNKTNGKVIVEEHYFDRRSRILIDKGAEVYLIPIKDGIIRDARTYFKDNLEKYKWKTFKTDILDEVVSRFKLNSKQENELSKTIESFKLNSDFPFLISPYKVALLLRAYDLNSGMPKIHLNEALDRLTYGTSEPSEEDKQKYDDLSEPYRRKALSALFKSTVVLQLGDIVHELISDKNTYNLYDKIQKQLPNFIVYQVAKGKDVTLKQLKTKKGAVKNPMEATIFLQGKQGAGKSTFVKNLALGHNYEIEKLDSNEQQTVFKRSQAVTLELGEGTAFKKSDVESLKREQTSTGADINLKYENGLTHFDYSAVMISTINQLDVLKDGTGERRNWPLVVDEKQVRSLSQDDFCTLGATLLIDMLSGNLNHDLSVIETEEDLRYKKAIFGQTDPVLDNLIEWFVDALATNAFQWRISGSDLVLPNRKTLQALINTDEETSKKRLYADKLTGLICGVEGANPNFRDRVHGGKKIKVSIKGLSMALFDDEDKLEKLLAEGKTALNPKQKEAIAVRTLYKQYPEDLENEVIYNELASLFNLSFARVRYYVEATEYSKIETLKKVKSMLSNDSESTQNEQEEDSILIDDDDLPF